MFTTLVFLAVGLSGWFAWSFLTNPIDYDDPGWVKKMTDDGGARAKLAERIDFEWTLLRWALICWATVILSGLGKALQ